jgi:thioredoxin 2
MATQHRTNVVTCGKCDRKNRVSPAGNGRPQCGNCHAPLPWIVDADDDTFEAVVERSAVPVVVDLWASWCAPCRQVSPVLEQLATEYAGRLKLVKIDIDAAPRTTGRFAVRAVPLLLLMQGKQVIANHPGAAPAARLRVWVDDGLAKASSTAA